MLHRNRAVIAIAVVAALVSAGPVAAAAAAKFVLGGLNAASSTTTIQMAAAGPVLSLQSSNSAGSSTGLNVTVPAGQPPITVSAGAGTATNLDADKLDGHDASDFVQGSVEGWHLVGTPGEPAWGRPTLTSVDPFLPAGFMKDPFGFVHLQGHVLAALDQPDGCDVYALFTLPAGDRPAATVTEAAVALELYPSTVVVADVDILATGQVELCSPRLLQYHWVSLDGLSFRAAP